MTLVSHFWTELKSVYAWEVRLSGPESCTYVLQSGEDILTDTVLVKLWLHGEDDVVDDSAINGGLEGSIRVTRPSST
jgi:hypothetical protein